MNLRLCLFDIDGTLIRRSRSEGQSLKTRSINHALRTVFGIEEIDYMSVLGKRIYGMTDSLIMRTAISRFGIDENRYRQQEPRLFRVIDDYFDENLSRGANDDYEKLPGIIEFLDFLKSDNARLGLVTGNIKRHADWKMLNAELTPYFETGAFGDDAEERSEIMSIALERNSDIPKNRICHFGDSPPDLEAARLCGIKAVAICDLGGGTHSRSELETAGHGLIVESWYDREAIQKYLA